MCTFQNRKYPDRFADPAADRAFIQPIAESRKRGIRLACLEIDSSRQRPHAGANCNRDDQTDKQTYRQTLHMISILGVGPTGQASVGTPLRGLLDSCLAGSPTLNARVLFSKSMTADAVLDMAT